MLPGLIVIGAMKAGTTALHEYLDLQPGVFMSDPKELDFFRLDGTWDRGIDWYRGCFADAGDAPIVGETSPNYTKRHSDPGVAERMHGVVPDARLVYLVRDPIDRIVSMYRHLVMEGMETRPFEQAVRDDPDYVDCSRYAYQLEPFIDVFGRDRLLVVGSSDLRSDRNGTIARVLRFAGAGSPDVDPARLSFLSNTSGRRRVARRLKNRVERFDRYRRMLDRSWRLRRIHHRVFTRPARPVEVVISDSTRAWLREQLVDDVGALRAITGDRVGDWGIL